MKSWKTTFGGIASILAALGLIAKAVQTHDYSNAPAIVAALGAGITGIAARDNNVSSEDAGIK